MRTLVSLVDWTTVIPFYMEYQQQTYLYAEFIRADRRFRVSHLTYYTDSWRLHWLLPAGTAPCSVLAALIQIHEPSRQLTL